MIGSIGSKSLGTLPAYINSSIPRCITHLVPSSPTLSPSKPLFARPARLGPSRPSPSKPPAPSMSRVTAVGSKLVRSLAATPARLDTTHNAGATLMPKYAELLRNRRSNEASPRGLTTTHRPTPQPSLANRAKPLMQAFSSSTPSAALAAATASHLDAAVLPWDLLALPQTPRDSGFPRVPLLPDNYGAAHGVVDGDGPVSIPSANIVAADPDNVLPATPLSRVHEIGLDVDLKFAHAPASGDLGFQPMLRMI